METLPVLVPAESSRSRGEPCANCGSALIGRFCHACGQQRTTADDLTVRHFAAHVVEEIEHLDSKTLRSLRGLLRPGSMTAEYVAGRRQRYLTPLRLYVVCAAIFFLAAPLVGFDHGMLRITDPASPLAPLVKRTMAASELDPERFLDRFDARFQTVYTVGLSISMLGAALMRVYGATTASALAKALAILVVAYVLDSLVAFGLMVATLATL